MSRLDNNLHALKRHQAHIHQAVLESPPHSSIHFEESRQGSPVAKVKLEEKVFWLHSRFDPIKEAERFIENQDLKATVILIYGFGCGYHIEALLKKAHSESKIIVVEPNISLFRSVVEKIDWVPLFADKRCKFLIGVRPQDIPTYFDPYLVPIFLGSKILTHEASVRATPGSYRLVSQAIKDFIEFGTTSLYTAASISAQSRFNTFMNLPHLLYNPGIAQFKGQAKGCAAVIVGAGPSLSKNVHLLKEAPVVKISTGTILKKLISLDIFPHFVCNIDYHAKSTKRYFQNLPDLPKTVLVSDPRSNFDVNDMYPGPVCTWEDNFLIKFLEGFPKEPHGTIQPAATVAQTSFFLAKYLGCDPIITVGLDLCYPGHITHAPGTAILDEWHNETNRFVSKEDKEWEYFARLRKSLSKVKDLEGNDVYTDRQMFTYIQLFNRLFKQTTERVIDASEEGSKKENCEIMTLAEALSQDFKKYKRDSFITDTFKWNNFSDKKNILRFLNNKLKTLEEIEHLYSKLLNLLQKIRDTIDTPECNPHMNNLGLVQEKLKKHKNFTEIINELVQSDEYRKQKNDQEILFSELTGTELKKKKLDRDVHFIQGLRGGVLFLKEFVAQGHLRCEAWPKHKPDGLLSELRIVQDKVNALLEKKDRHENS